MPKIFIFTVDLISKKEFSKSKIQEMREKNSSLQRGNNLLDVVLDSIQQTKDGRMEIYLEDLRTIVNSREEALNFIKNLEERVGGFISGSCFEIGEEISSPYERWIRTDYSWEMEDSQQEENQWDKESYWEGDWEEWNEEWN